VRGRIFQKKANTVRWRRRSIRLRRYFRVKHAHDYAIRVPELPSDDVGLPPPFTVALLYLLRWLVVKFRNGWQ